MKKLFFLLVLAGLGGLTTPAWVWANGLTISNVTLEDRNQTAGTAVVQFDIRWDNSWRDTSGNHDAVWLFLKVNVGGTWYHGPLRTAGTDPADTSPGSNPDLEVIVPSDSGTEIGAFIRRKDIGRLQRGTVSSSHVRLTLDYGNISGTSVTATTQIQVRVFGIEMVYIPTGSFYAGQSGGGAPTGAFGGTGGSTAWNITSEGAITTATSGSSWIYVAPPSVDGGSEGTYAIFTIIAGFPKGYNDFYCMKYEITEGQYVQFLNTLTSTQMTARDITLSTNGGKSTDSWSYRNTISGSSTSSYQSYRPYRAVGYLSWADLAAYLDWAGLRPMTELEYEKVARGTSTVVSGEYAWGNTTLISNTSIYGTETGSEVFTLAGPSAVWGNTTLVNGDSTSSVDYNHGPVRSGIFATTASSRVEAGAGAYGVMELSGNIEECVVGVGMSATHGVFSGLHGDGTLTSLGETDAVNWPDRTSALGVGYRGGMWNSISSGSLRISDRSHACLGGGATRTFSHGGRGVRTAP